MPTTVPTVPTSAITFDSDTLLTVYGVPGHLTHRTVKPGETPGCWTHQRWVSNARPVKGQGVPAALTVELCFDDDCRNGHNTFRATGEIRATSGKVREHDLFLAGGMLHDEIAQYFPELAPVLKWHLVSSDGPLHYLANTVYHAGDRDHNGLRAGESRQIRNGKTGELSWILQGPGTQYADGATPPASEIALRWAPWCRIGEGKARELDHARSSAVWPDATDEQLSVEPDRLRAVLTARLPALMGAFRTMVEGAGLHWAPDNNTVTDTRGEV